MQKKKLNNLTTFITLYKVILSIQYIIDEVLYVEGVKFHRGRFKGTIHFRNNLGLKDSLDPFE